MLTKDDIMKILPHREPMLFLDEAFELTPGKRAVCMLTLSGKEDFFRGHFPENPVMPGVLTLEALAQTGAVAVLTLPEFQGKTGYLAGVKSARYRRKISPGETVRLEVEIVKMRGGIGIGKGRASVDGEIALEAELTFAIQ